MALSRIWASFIVIAFLAATFQSFFVSESKDIYSRMIVGNAGDTSHTRVIDTAALSPLALQVVNRGDDPANWLENSCSCLYVAALCKAIRKGLLDASYLEYARKGYEGVIRSLTWEGDDLIIGNVCIGTGVGDYDHYIHRPVSANDLHGVGAFLLMCEECEQVF